MSLLIILVQLTCCKIFRNYKVESCLTGLKKTDFFFHFIVLHLKSYRGNDDVMGRGTLILINLLDKTIHIPSNEQVNIGTVMLF